MPTHSLRNSSKKHNSGCPDGMRHAMNPADKWGDPIFEFGNMTLHGEARAWKIRRISMDSPPVVDSISCRQMYLRSYTFTTREEETFKDKTRKCLGRLRKSVAYGKLMVLRKARETSHDTLLSIYSRLISCTTKIDIA